MILVPNTCDVGGVPSCKMSVVYKKIATSCNFFDCQHLQFHFWCQRL